MNEDENAVQNTDSKIINFLKKKEIYLTILIIIIMSLNLYINSISRTSYATNLKGKVQNSQQIKDATKNTLIYGFPFIGFFIGLLLCSLPFKRLKKNIKCISVSLQLTLSFHVIYFLFELFLYIRDGSF